jgi:WS/DGAT/MGAT family acyltransferase
MFALVYELGATTSAGPGRAPRQGGEQPPTPVAIAAHATVALLTTPLRLGRAVGVAAGAAVRTAGALLDGEGASSVLPFVGPRTSLNGELSSGRSFAFVSIDLTHVKEVKNAFGVKVNDVVLAVCGAALRAYLEKQGQLPDRALNATVPAAVGGLGAQAGALLGNATSVIGATLATDVENPSERLRRIHESTSRAKAVHRALGDETILRLADTLPPGVFGAAVRAYAATGLAGRLTPPFNAVVSNLPGPSVPLYSGGARVEACYLFGPLVPSVALDITVLSYRDSVDVGIAASPNLVPDAWPIAEAVPDALAELLVAARARTGA